MYDGNRRSSQINVSFVLAVIDSGYRSRCWVRLRCCAVRLPGSWCQSRAAVKDLEQWEGAKCHQIINSLVLFIIVKSCFFMWGVALVNNCNGFSENVFPERNFECFMLLSQKLSTYVFLDKFVKWSEKWQMLVNVWK